MMLRLLVLSGLLAFSLGVRMRAGGVKDVDPEEIEPELFDKIRAHAVNHFNLKLIAGCSKCNPNTYYTFFHMKSLKKQLVSGMKYDATFTLLPTKCANNNGTITTPPRLLSECKPISTEAPQTCHGVFLEKAWLKQFKVLDMQCIPQITFILHRSARSVSTHAEAAQVGSRGSFLLFKAKYGRSYSSPTEEEKRYQVFRANMQKAHVLTRLEHGSATYGESPFADMTEAEFRHTRLTPVWDQTNMPEKLASVPSSPAPTAFDWRQHNAVTAVKNQGSCGSCWAFSTTGNVEGQWAIHKRKLVSLSEQELVDCDKVDQGCGGGLPSNAYKAIMKLGGLETEAAYPYEAENDKCHFNRALVRAYVNSSVSLPQDETKLAAWLAQNGPISIGINAFAMQFYMGGISHPWSFLCNPSKLDHGVLLVGYGVQGSEPYWIVKNSWGASWGEKGYYLVYRGSGVCGLNRMATSAVVN